MSTEAFYYQTRTRYKQFVIVQALVYVYIYSIYTVCNDHLYNKIYYLLFIQ